MNSEITIWSLSIFSFALLCLSVLFWKYGQFQESENVILRHDLDELRSKKENTDFVITKIELRNGTHAKILTKIDFGLYFDCDEDGVRVYEYLTEDRDPDNAVSRFASSGNDWCIADVEWEKLKS